MNYVSVSPCHGRRREFEFRWCEVDQGAQRTELGAVSGGASPVLPTTFFPHAVPISDIKKKINGLCCAFIFRLSSFTSRIDVSNSFYSE
jgi:hypothetical protein